MLYELKIKMIKAKKYIETKQDGEYEITKHHTIEIKDFNIKLFNHILDETYILDDGEDSYYAGVPTCIDGGIAYLDVNNFLAFLEGKIEEYEEEQKEKQDYDNSHFIIDMKNMFKYLEKYLGYTIWGV